MPPPVKIVVAWFTRENYERHRKLDPDGLQATFDDWLKNATAGCNELKRKGLVADPITIDPDELAAWCASARRKVDGKSRADFAAMLAERRSHN